MQITAFITDTPPRVVPHQAAGLELRHRQHARVEDRIREAKNTGLRTCRAWNENNAWLQVVLTAVDRIDKHWRWAAQIAEAFTRLRGAFT
jgi:hypothetical protein